MPEVVVSVVVKFPESDGRHVELPPAGVMVQSGNVAFDPDLVDADVGSAVVAAAGGVAGGGTAAPTGEVIEPRQQKDPLGGALRRQ